MSIVLGVDIVKGSIHGKIKPRYAVVILDNGNEIEKIVSRSKLFRITRELKPDIVAIDNIYEIFKSKDDLVSFLREIPPKTKLVQVSGRNASLPALSRRFGLKINIRNPTDEARACAYLASFGVGYEVSVFMDKTKITVSRSRSLGKGGWRQKKYGRRVHDAVRRIYREIRDKLDELGLEYTEEVRKGYGGISKGVLLVDMPKQNVPVNSFRSRDVQVRVEAVEKERIEFIPLSRTHLYTIVGIDPGTTTAVAVMDLSGNLVEVKSRKNWSAGEVVEYISSLGKPVVIATDKSVAPDYVLKIKAAFNAVLYTPKEDMSVDKKRELTGRYKPVNDHERDALAAAIDAFNSYKNKLRNVEKRIPAGLDSDRIKAEIIRGTPLKEFLIEESVEEKVEKKPRHEEITREDLERKDKLIRELMEENKILRNKNVELKEEIERLRSKLVTISSEEHEKIRRENYIKTLEGEIRELRRQLRESQRKVRELEERVEMLKRIKTLAFQGWREVKVLRKFTKEEIDRLDREYGIREGDVIYILNSSGGGTAAAESLCQKGIKAVIYESEMSHLAVEAFERRNIPRIHSSEIEILASEDVAIVNARKFDEVYERKVEEMRRRSVEKIEKLLEEYRKRRV
jgi:hypothetical protein